MADLQLTAAEQAHVDAYVRKYGENTKFRTEDTTIMLPSGREMSPEQMNAMLDAAHGRHRHIGITVGGKGVLLSVD